LLKIVKQMIFLKTSTYLNIIGTIIVSKLLYNSNNGHLNILIQQINNFKIQDVRHNKFEKKSALQSIDLT